MGYRADAYRAIADAVSPANLRVNLRALVSINRQGPGYSIPNSIRHCSIIESNAIPIELYAPCAREVASGLEPLDPTARHRARCVDIRRGSSRYRDSTRSSHQEHGSPSESVASGLRLVSSATASTIPPGSRSEALDRPRQGLDRLDRQSLKPRHLVLPTEPRRSGQRFNRNSASRRHTSHRAGAEPAAERPRRGLLRQETT